MIKLCRFVYIHVLTVVLFVYCYITRRLELLGMTYLIMVVHELFHMFAALLIGLRPSHMIFYPFGVNLRLKNKLVYSLSDEIILYLAGPFANILMALVAVLFFRNLTWWYDFYLKNICLFVLNLLPIMPLDGGVVLKKILMHRIGFKRAERVVSGISVFLILVLSGLIGYMAIERRFSFSACFFVLFLIGSVVTAKEKYNMDFVKELLYYKEKGIKFENKTVKTMVIKKGTDPRKVAEQFTLGTYYVLFILDRDGAIDRIITESQLLREMVTK